MNNYIKKHKKIFIILILIIIFAGVYYWKNSSNVENTTVQYKTGQVEKGLFISSVSGSGNIIVDKTSTVDPTITGTITNLSVNIGDYVKKGQLLFNIINDDLNVSDSKAISSLQQAKNSIESAEVQVKQAKADYDSAEDDDSKTKKQKDVLKKKISVAENAVIAAQKSYEASLADYKNQFATSAKRTVTSPIDGTVNAVNIKNGDDLSRLSSNSNSSAPIIIGDLSTLKAQIEINEVDISNVIVGQKATITFNGIDELSVTGKVEKIDSLGSENSGVVTYNVIIGLDDLDERIKPAMTVSCSIITNTKQNVLLVPNSAIKTSDGNSYVQILEGNIAKNKNIEIGLGNDNYTEILSGLNEGENIIIQTINSSSKTTSTSKSNSSSSNSLKLPGLSGGGMRP